MRPVAALVFASTLLASSPAVAQLLPAPELETGTLTVKVVGGHVGDQRVGFTVRLDALDDAKGAPQIAKTGADGRARFTKLLPGRRYRAAVPGKGGEHTSPPFAMPAKGGGRILVTLGAASTEAHGKATKPASQPQKPHQASPPGASPHGASPHGAAATPNRSAALRIARGSHVIAQVGEGGLSILLVFVLQHGSISPYPLPKGGLQLQLPRGARNVDMQKGAKRLGRLNAAKDTIVLDQVIPPGGAQVQVSFDLMADQGRIPFRMPLPLPLEGAIFAITPDIGAKVDGPHVTRHEVRQHQGETIGITHLSSIPAGDAIDLRIEGLPSRDNRPMLIALALSLLIAIWATYAAATPRIHIRRQERRREGLLEELAQLRSKRDAGGLDDEAHDARAAVLRRELQKVWPAS